MVSTSSTNQLLQYIVEIRHYHKDRGVFEHLSCSLTRGFPVYKPFPQRGNEITVFVLGKLVSFALKF